MPEPRLNWWESIFFLIFILIAAFILVSSPLFEVKALTVEGNHLLEAEKVRSTSGITLGSNIFRVRLGEARERLEALSPIRKVELVRRFPATVHIVVEERVPVALLDIDGEFWEIDVEAVPVRKKGPGWDGLPVITGVGAEDPNLARVAEAVVGLPTGVVRGLSEVSSGDDLRLTLLTFEGIEIRLGSMDRLEYKGAVLQEVLELVRREGRKVEYIDLAEPEKPVVKYAGGVSGVKE